MDESVTLSMEGVKKIRTFRAYLLILRHVILNPCKKYIKRVIWGHEVTMDIHGTWIGPTSQREYKFKHWNKYIIFSLYVNQLFGRYGDFTLYSVYFTTPCIQL